AQAGCLERIVHLGHTEHRPAPKVIRRQANVVEAMIRECEAAMAVHAARLSDEQTEPRFLLRGESTVVSSDPLVETGRWRDQSPLVCSKSLQDVCRADRGVRREGHSEGLAIGWISREPRGDILQIGTHLVGML